MIACALLKTRELLFTRQIRGYKVLGTILLKYPALQAGEVVYCYVFTRDINGMKASNSRYVEVKGYLFTKKAVT
jgi:hypothetical protein